MTNLWCDFEMDFDVPDLEPGMEGDMVSLGVVQFLFWKDDDQSSCVVEDEYGRKHIVFVEDVNWFDE